MPDTFADVADLMRDTGFKPQTSIQDGIRDLHQRDIANYYKV